MKLTIQREALLKPLQIVSGVVERRQTLPILSNVLLISGEGKVSLTGTDLEVEMIAHVPLPDVEEGEITLPARKFLDICRTLPEKASIAITVDKGRALLRSGKSRFTLSTLPASEFPTIDPVADAFEFSIDQRQLRILLDQTQFCMAHQDVRYYLNGLMLELSDGLLRAVATDGHRLAFCEVAADITIAEPRQIILPRKCVLELSRLLQDSDVPAKISLGSNHIQIALDAMTFTSQLIDGRFPDYQRVVPSGGDKAVHADRERLRQAFIRTAVLSNEKFRGVRLHLSENLLQATVHNPDQEEAEEEVEVSYTGEEFEIGFNINYFLDALAVLNSENVTLTLSDANSSCLIQGDAEPYCKYVIMPMRL